MTSYEIKEYWNENLYLYRDDTLTDLGLSKDNIDFLSTVGFLSKFILSSPIGGPNNVNEKLLKVSSVFNRDVVRIFFDSKSTNTNRGVYIDINDNAVYYFNDARYIYINNNIESFVKSLTKMHQIIENYGDLIEVELDEGTYSSSHYEAIEEFINFLKEIDYSALDNLKNYWVLDSFEYLEDTCFYHKHNVFQQAIIAGKYSTYDEARYDVLLNGYDVLEK